MPTVEVLNTVLLLAAALSLVMAVAWLIHRQTGNAGFIDMVWTFGLAAIGVAAALWPAPSEAGGRACLVALLTIVWALRLGSHIAHRSFRLGDDPRYAELQRSWGDDAPQQMFILLQKQAIVSIPLALTLYLAAHFPQPLWRPIDVLGVCVVLAGLTGEAIADQQLRAFRAAQSKPGSICDRGVWAWSRHPNYFFEWLTWCGVAMLGLGMEPMSWLVLAGPLAMYWLLTSVSGIPPLEQHMLRTRGDAYRLYQSRTSAFFPTPPRRSAS